MLSGAEATFLARLAQPDHSGPVWLGSRSGFWVSAGERVLEAGGWRRTEGVAGGVLPVGLGSDLWSTVCVICGNVTDDWPPCGDLLQDDE